jgi:hypothetical protein
VTNSLSQGSIADVIEFQKTHVNEQVRYLGVLGTAEIAPGLSYDAIIPIRTRENNTRIDIAALDRVVDAIKKYHKEGSSVVVFCAAGVERSPLAAIYYLYKTNVLPLQEAYRFYRSRRAILPSIEQDIADIETAEGRRLYHASKKPHRRAVKPRNTQVHNPAREGAR